jgi:alpha-galactosidase
MTRTLPPSIHIIKKDDREISNLRLSVSFKIDGVLHSDYQDYGTFSNVTVGGLSASNGTFNGSEWVGNFLYTHNSQSTESAFREREREAAQQGDNWGYSVDDVSPSISIKKEDSRNITEMRIRADFTIQGQQYTDYEDIANFDRKYFLSLKAYDGTWDGSQWKGDFLKVTGSGYDTEIDPDLLSFFNFLVAAGRLSNVGFHAGSGGGWSRKQIM